MLHINGRTADYPIDPIFLERWSPRAFTGEAIPHPHLLTILEAARWAPSSFNAQPWRFLYAHRDTPHWPRFFGLLSESNQAWAERAAALIFLLSKSHMRPRGADRDVSSYTHSFDAGAAWAQLALEATRIGWPAHGMAGFDRERAVVELQIPPGYRIEAAIAIGRRADPAILTERFRERETPSSRQPLSSTVFEGLFPAKNGPP
jgi:nitroreductase